jgi:hypothetical protein
VRRQQRSASTERPTLTWNRGIVEGRLSFAFQQHFFQLCCVATRKKRCFFVCPKSKIVKRECNNEALLSTSFNENCSFRHP